jgi:hypothetical protein
MTTERHRARLSMASHLHCLSASTDRSIVIVVSYLTFLCFQFNLYRPCSLEHHAPSPPWPPWPTSVLLWWPWCSLVVTRWCTKSFASGRTCSLHREPHRRWGSPEQSPSRSTVVLLGRLSLGLVLSWAAGGSSEGSCWASPSRIGLRTQVMGWVSKREKISFFWKLYLYVFLYNP